jgi:ankyrin repeat protein
MAFYGRPGAISALLARGAEVGVVSHNGQTPLHRAAVSGDERSTELIVDAGADLDARARHRNFATGFAPSFSHQLADRGQGLLIHVL